MESILAFRGDYFFLSNFYPCLINYQDRVFSCVECAFQAEKCLSDVDKNIIAKMATGAEAKKYGRRVRMRPDWESIKFMVMQELIAIKFEYDPQKTKLLATGDTLLIEGNLWHDNFWGYCLCDNCLKKPYHNWLGNFLMSQRTILLRA